MPNRSGDGHLQAALKRRVPGGPGEKGFSDPLTVHPASGWRSKGDLPPPEPVPSSISSPRPFASCREYLNYAPLTMRRNANVSR